MINDEIYKMTYDLIVCIYDREKTTKSLFDALKYEYPRVRAALRRLAENAGRLDIAKALEEAESWLNPQPNLK